MDISPEPYYFNYLVWENSDQKTSGISGNKTGEENVCFLILINVLTLFG